MKSSLDLSWYWESGIEINDEILEVIYDAISKFA